MHDPEIITLIERANNLMGDLIVDLAYLTEELRDQGRIKLQVEDTQELAHSVTRIFSRILR